MLFTKSSVVLVAFICFYVSVIVYFDKQLFFLQPENQQERLDYETKERLIAEDKIKHYVELKQVDDVLLISCQDIISSFELDTQQIEDGEVLRSDFTKSKIDVLLTSYNENLDRRNVLIKHLGY